MKERLSWGAYKVPILSNCEVVCSVKQQQHDGNSRVVMLIFALFFTIKNYVGPVAQLVRAVDS